MGDGGGGGDNERIKKNLETELNNKPMINQPNMIYKKSFIKFEVKLLFRYKVLVTGGQEFVLMVRDVGVAEAGQYQCQVSGPQHTSLTRTLTLTVIGRAPPSPGPSPSPS